MAVYPEGNPGVVPIDATTAVGQFRNASGNTAYTAYDPDEPGYGNFTYLSDAEIEQYLTLAGDSIPGGIGYWYLSLAGAAALESKNIKDFDLQVSTEKRAADLRAQAEFYLNLGGLGDGAEYFGVVQTGRRSTALERWSDLVEGAIDGSSDPMDYIY